MGIRAAHALRGQACRPLRSPRAYASRRIHRGHLLLRACRYSGSVAVLYCLHHRPRHRQSYARWRGASHRSGQLLQPPPHLALGISAMARPFGGAINIQIFSLIAIATSWRTAFRAHGAISLLIVIPLLLVMRRRPSDIGLQPDGGYAATASSRRIAGGGSAQTLRRAEPDWRMGQAARTSAFWLIVIAEALVILISGTINFQIGSIPPRRRNISGSCRGRAQRKLSGGFTRQPVLGLALRHFLSPQARAHHPCHIRRCRLPVRRCSRGATKHRSRHPLRHSCGGLNILGHMMIAQYFGRSSFGSITGLMGPFQTGALGLGPTLGAIIYRITGGYRAIYLFGVLSYILAFACITAARPPKLPNQ